jgi:rod shape-determining protein MreD
MMISRGQGRLLLPVRPSFVMFSITAATVLQIALLLIAGRSGVWLPDFLVLVLLHWVLVVPRWVNLGWAFFLGLCLDMLHYGLLGQHALAFVCMAALVLMLARRLPHFTSLEQVPQIWGVLVLGQIILVTVGVLASWTWPGWLALCKPFIEAALWPAVVWLLQIPQRRAHDEDLHRPLAM